MNEPRSADRSGDARHVITVVPEAGAHRPPAGIEEIVRRRGGRTVALRTIGGGSGHEFVADLAAVSDLPSLRTALFDAARADRADVGMAMERDFRAGKRLVMFDMDSTLVAAEGIDLLAAAAGVHDKVAKVTREAMEGRLEFSVSLERRVACLAGLREEAMLAVIDRMPLSPEVVEVVASLKRLGYRLGVVTGGFTAFADALAQRLGLDYAFANRLVIRDGRLTGAVEYPILDAPAKEDRLRTVAGREGIPMSCTAAVGDGANDVPMLRAAGFGVAYRAKDAARRVADAVIERHGFAGLPLLLGEERGAPRTIDGE